MGGGEKVRTGNGFKLNMSIQLSGFDRVRELERGGDGGLGWPCRILVEMDLLNRDRERRCLRFITQALHPDVVRKKFLVENNPEFLVLRPIFGWFKNQNVVFDPMPGAVEMRLEFDALHC